MPSFGRLTIVVVDPSGTPLSGVCVIVGTAACTPDKPHTDAAGRWSADVPMASPTLFWDVGLSKPGYVSVRQTFVLRTGQQVVYTVRLSPIHQQ
jgi:hypothetical protein